MSRRYLVITERLPAFDPAAIAPHYAFLARLRAERKIELAGPFADRSGGAYLLRAKSPAEAEALAHSDPLHATGSSRVTVREWDAG
jgi:uncharacterized protein